MCADSHRRIKELQSETFLTALHIPLPFHKEKGRFPSTFDSWAAILPLEFVLRRYQVISPSPSVLSCSIRAYMSQRAHNMHVRHLHCELLYSIRSAILQAVLGWGRGDQIQESHDSALPQLPEVACVTQLPLACSFWSPERQVHNNSTGTFPEQTLLYPELCPLKKINFRASSFQKYSLGVMAGTGTV